VFFGWAYLKTDNIWTVVILHFLTNNLVPIISGVYTPDVLQNQAINWNAVLFSLIINVLLFMGFAFTAPYRDYTRRLPTMDERADRQE
jgi:membrane protease YdiL (CAAX protease family)